METTFFGQTRETGIYITENGFPPQNDPHTAKLRFSDLLKLFESELGWGYCLCREFHQMMYFFWHLILNLVW